MGCGDLTVAQRGPERGGIAALASIMDCPRRETTRRSSRQSCRADETWMTAVRQAVGCGHVFGVGFAAVPRPQINVRLRCGSPASCTPSARSGSNGMPLPMPISLASSQCLLASSIRPRAPCNQYAHAGHQPVFGIVLTARAMRLAEAMVATLSGFVAISRPGCLIPRCDTAFLSWE